MFQKLATLINDEETLTIVVKKKKENLTVTIAPVVKEDTEARLKPVSANGTPEELDEQLLEKFGEALSQSRKLLIDTQAMLESAAEKPEEKKPAAKKKETTEKAGRKGKAESKSETPSNSLWDNATTENNEKTDQEIDDELSAEYGNEKEDTGEKSAVQEAPAPAAPVIVEPIVAAPIPVVAAPAVTPEPAPQPTKVSEVKLTKEQRAVVDNTVRSLEQAKNRNDFDVSNYLKKQALKSLTDAELPDVVINGFTKKFDEIIATQEQPQVAEVEESPWN